MKRRTLIGTAVAAGLASLTARAQTPAWPQRPVKLIVSYPAGSSPDVVARLLANRTAGPLGQAVVVDNKAGAGGNLGTGLVAKSPPDSHTFLFTTQAPLVTAPLLVKQLPYDPFKELMPVSQVATVPLLLVADARLGVTRLDDFVKLARQKAGQFNYASTGNGNATHLAMELFKTRAGVDILHVPYASSPAAVTSMLAGQIQISFMVPSVAMGQIQAGKLVPLGMTSLARLPSLPDIPTIAEQGLPGFEVVAWHAVMAPAGTPGPVVDRMADELTRAVKSDELRTAMLAQHFAPSGAGPAELAGIMKNEYALWGRVAQAAGVKPE